MAEQNNADDVRTRLQRAALELFREHGYERTTAAGIAARMGVTERTFFRYFPDKRETLFGGEAILREALTEAVAAAPAGLAPLDTLFHAFQATVPLLEANRSYSEPWYEVVRATPALHERELAKREVLADSLAEALARRGVGEPVGWLAARAGMAAYAQATVEWLHAPEPGLAQRFDAMLDDLRALSGPAVG